LKTALHSKPALHSRPAFRRAGLAAWVAVLGAGGCGSVDNRPAEWAYISPALFQPNCATTSCHSLTGLWVWVVVTDGGVSPPAGVPCATINGTFVCEQQLRPLVTPYDPAGSRVVDMLRARNAPRMPPDRPLPEADIELVERWILNGACRTGLSCNDAPVAAARIAAQIPVRAGARNSIAGD
jgi:hypothetical protein